MCMWSLTSRTGREGGRNTIWRDNNWEKGYKATNLTNPMNPSSINTMKSV